MYYLAKDQQCFLVDLLPMSPPMPKATQIQCDEGNSRIPIAEYHMEYQGHTSFTALLCEDIQDTLWIVAVSMSKVHQANSGS